MTTTLPPPPSSRLPGHSSGTVLILALIGLVILSLAAVALIYSSETSLITAGNLGLKRDMTNQSERAVAAARARFESGGLNSVAALQNDQPAENYSAIALPSDKHGIPGILLDDAAFTARYGPANDITDSSANVTLRYVIDRMCRSAGAFSANNCAISGASKDVGGSDISKPPSTTPPVYRITTRVTGPRNVQSFVQSTLSYAPTKP
ncbi:type IV pilus assembly protein PilX [Actimicrobium sp. GrIS 1.19]|uniref:pilus assembly PilX family protein n=1 Tax=Actimicrobium sp. GrIS 1.19 TaxID=3071708 RepID=UPI002E0CBF3F|nr:type IV pilus assembly protein PilX [Actimicrobium sp. GrIS 1.19]